MLESQEVDTKIPAKSNEICLSTGCDHQNLSSQGDNIEALRKPDKDLKILVITISVTTREEMKPEPSVPWLKQVSEAEEHGKVDESAGPFVPGLIMMKDNKVLAPKIKILWIKDRGKQPQESNFSKKRIRGSIRKKARSKG